MFKERQTIQDRGASSPFWDALGYQKPLWSLGQQALAGDSMEQLYRQAAHYLSAIPDIEHCSCWELLSDGVQFRSVGILEKGSTLARKVGGTKDNIPERVVDSVHRYQLSNAHCLQLHSVQENNESTVPELALGDDIIGLLIPGHEKPVGMVVVMHSTNSYLSKKTLMLLRGIVQILGTAFERKRSDALLMTQTSVLQTISEGRTLEDTFQQLCKLIEVQTPGAYCSILLLDRQTGQLRSGAAPSLPNDYAQALDGLVIGECAGSCGTAAYTGTPVFVDDISTDPLWEPFRDLALSHGIHACWSIPFTSQKHEVLGTFALSHPIACKPTKYHRQILQTAANLASIATEGHRSAEELRKLANYDSLTGLTNRFSLSHHLNSLLKKYQKDEGFGQKFSVLFLDLDRFKLVNDSLGHSIGDLLLIRLTKLIKNCLTEKDVFARLGGDEFAIVLEEVENIEQVIAVVDRILSVLNSPIDLNDYEVFTTLSIGIVHDAGQYDSPEEILRDADTAMYQAKHQRKVYTVFSREMHQQNHERLHIELELRHAVETLTAPTGDIPFYIVFQPILELETQQLIGFESLIRWRHPQEGLIPPCDFIPVAEETGLIVPLSQWIFRQVCQQVSLWQQKYDVFKSLYVSINISGTHFLLADVYEQLTMATEEANITADSIFVEVTESVLIDVSSSALEQLNRLNKCDFKISLDDFGTGYSSLGYLQSFPAHCLKVDRRFVQELHGKKKGQIVEAIISLAHTLGMQAIAEGIESPEQLARLKDIGCDFGQGYLFAKPLEVDQVEAFLQKQQIW